ncbi:hypothetical protein MIR68_002175 [Amoeboaphelidium protococcarum]|nr:hypothetical protein MIR68_002175 [Amoeboaphelidium protococcarum]
MVIIMHDESAEVNLSQSHFSPNSRKRSSQHIVDPAEQLKRLKIRSQQQQAQPSKETGQYGVDGQIELSQDQQDIIQRLAQQENVIRDLQLQLRQAFPYNKNGLSRDDYTYIRVQNQYTSLCDALQQMGESMLACKDPQTGDKCRQFLTDAVHQLPEFDNARFNTRKVSLIAHLT